MRYKLFTYLYILVGLLFLSGCGTGNIETTIETDASSKDEITTNLESPEIIENPSKDDKVEVLEIDPLLSKMTVHYIDVGQADATLLEFNDGNEEYKMLIDTGNWSSSDVVSYLHTQNIKDIDIIAITHPHADHIGQLDQVINEFNVDEVWMNGEVVNSQIFAASIAAIKINDVDYYEPQVDDVFDIGPVEVSILHPNTLLRSTNDNSLVLRIQYGEIIFLFTGDAERQAENEMVSIGVNLKAHILQVGHHGSSTSSTERFLQAVDPETAIYSAGAGNSYGHPNLETIERIEASGTHLYGTDVHGTILVETDGKTYTVLTSKQGTIQHHSPTGSDEDNEAEDITYTETKPTSSCIDINTASDAEIQSIIHIGTSRHLDLINLRPFNSVDDLSKIKGIGPARIKDIIAQGFACTGG
ncbi:MBL fold metallo-hydrolase [Sporosarcina siberiensis]|uniref:MBL fold metallo-hydrolase n=1 Tax=Sporosarcina siberiensis TaxID=1365606 RepID=A0ABW4SJ96_9BACL